MKKLIFLLLLLAPLSTLASASIDCERLPPDSQGIGALFQSYKCGKYTFTLPDTPPYRIIIYDHTEQIDGIGSASTICGNAQYVTLNHLYKEGWREYTPYVEVLGGFLPDYKITIGRGGFTTNCVCPTGQSFGDDKMCHTQDYFDKLKAEKELADKQAEQEAERIKKESALNYLKAIQEADRKREEEQILKQREENNKIIEAQKKVEEEKKLTEEKRQNEIQSFTLKGQEVENQKRLIDELARQNALMSQMITNPQTTATTGYTGTTQAGTTRVKTRIELLRERFYANQKARLEAHYARMKAIGDRYRELQK